VAAMMKIVLVALALLGPVLQGTLLAGALPGGRTPDLVLAVVTAGGLAWGADAGALWGLVAGLWTSAAAPPGAIDLVAGYAAAGAVAGSGRKQVVVGILGAALAQQALLWASHPAPVAGWAAWSALQLCLALTLYLLVRKC